MTESVTMPQSSDAFHTVSTLARLSAEYTDLYGLLNATLRISLERLPITGAIIWLRANDQDVLTPGISRVPPTCAASAITEDDPLIAQMLAQGHIMLSGETHHVLVPPASMSGMLAPIRSDDVLLGMIAYVGTSAHLAALSTMLEASANILSGSLVSAWLRRQQAEADDVATTLFQFASELRSQQSLHAILQTLNNLALRVFNCDWSAVYIWQDDEPPHFVPIQIMTRVGEQSVRDEPELYPEQNPVIEFVLNNYQLLSLPDLREQPTALPVYAQRHALRGIVLVPIQHSADRPLGLLSVGYRAPIITFNGRAHALAQGLARMVAVALERTQIKTRERAVEN